MRFVTLGPEGTCHQHATKHYLRYHGIEDAEIVLVTDFLDGLEMVYSDQADFLLQNSAHLAVNLVTEKYYCDVFVADTFLYTTQEIVVLEDARIEAPETIGLVSATEGYIHDIPYAVKIYEPSKPIVGAKLLEGAYDAGVTYLHYHINNPGRFRVRKYIGHVPTAWLVYGKKTTFAGDMLGVAPRGFYTTDTGVSDWPRGGAVYEAPPEILAEMRSSRVAAEVE